MIQIISKAHLFPGFPLKVINSLFQFCQVIQPVLFTTAAQHIFISAFVKNCGQQVCQIHAVKNRPVFFNQTNILSGSAALKQFCIQAGCESIIQTAPVQRRIFLQRTDAGPPYTASRFIDRTKETDIIAAVNHPQIADHILDLLAFVKLHTGVEHIGDLVADQGFFHCTGYIMSPVQHRHGRIGSTAFMHGPHIGGHPVCLQLSRFCMEIQWFLCIRSDGCELFFQSFPVLVDERIGGPQNLRNAAVIRIQINGFHMFMSGIEFQNELHICTAPGINGLIRITHHKEVFMISGENVCQGILILVNVLKFIHHDVFQTLLPFFPDFPVLLQNIECKVHQIIKIQSVAFPLLVEVSIHDFVFQGSRFFGQFQQLFGISNQSLYIASAAFSPANMINCFFHRHIPAGDAQIFKDNPQDRFLILLIQYNKTGGILYHMAIFLQKSHTKAMKCGNPSQILIW